MINIINKEDCCGCNACVQKCPKQCITTKCDSEGFWYPVADKDICNNCGLCEKVCPVINQRTEQRPIETFAATNKNENIRLKSSSGGVFSLFAEETIKAGGVVFGAAFNQNWEVEHIAIDTIEELEKLRGSKYVQSNIGDCYKKTKQFLKEGRKVLFSGTPCQIAALRLFLNKEYENLTTIDVVCHGAPSPAVWREYLKETIEKEGWDRVEKNSVSSAPGGGKKSCIKSISFRSKISGWKKYSFSIQSNFSNSIGKNTVFFQETLNNNTFMRCFLANLCLRPSCYACPARNGKSGSDFTLADLWGAEHICPHLDDDKGLSLLLLRNSKKALPPCNLHKIDYKKALAYNPSIEEDVAVPAKRERFFKLLHLVGVYKATEKCLYKSKLAILWMKIKWHIKKRL